jgi:TRAP-type C4-dicarboxylate transport system permease small subunit
MGLLYWACLALSGLAIAAMTVIIVWSVFTRYVLSLGAFWAEPIAIFLAVQMTFFGAAACYRAGAHISIDTIVNSAPAALHRPLEWLVDILMATISLFMVIYGISLVETTWNQVYPEFEKLRVGFVYASIPVGGFITLLFVIERALIGPAAVDGAAPEESL